MTPVIEVRGVTKRFPGVLANDEVDLTLNRGEVLALLGENGAGKSTLMNIIYGLYQPDEGEILVDGQPVTFDDPSDAIAEGIGMVHQHFMLVPVMTVAENIMLGVEETEGNTIASASAATLLAGVIGLAAGGWLAALYFVLVAGAYAVFALTTETKPAMGNILFGALTGLGFGILFEGINLVLAAGQPAALLWPLFGAAIGVVANLRWVDAGGVKRRIRILSEKYKLDVDPDAYIRDLSVGAQQRVEIIKALYRDSGVLILDEPTAVLTPQEADELFDIMRSLTRQGVSIIFITHKLGEVLSIADRIIVMRRGRVVGETTPEQATRASLAEMMVGREVVLRVLKEEARPTQDVLVVQDLVVHDERGHTAVDAVSFAIRSGEIVGIAGVQGNGQSELVEAVTGLRPAQSGRITILDRPLRRADPRAVTTLGVAHIPEDRQRHGLVLSYPVADNMVLADYHRSPFSDGVRLNEEQIEENADALIEQYDIRTPSIFTQASKLSGGNQQKVIVAREIARSPRLLIASQPTRGLDVGSIEFIHNQIVAARDSGAAVLLVSAELDEILSLADRVLVMYRGRVMADLPIDEATREKLGLLMAGVDLHE